MSRAPPAGAVTMIWMGFVGKVWAFAGRAVAKNSPQPNSTFVNIRTGFSSNAVDMLLAINKCSSREMACADAPETKAMTN